MAAQPDHLPPSADAVIVSCVRDALPDVRVLCRFRSSVTGAARADSDIDLAVLADCLLDPSTRFDLQEQVASALRRAVDLVDLRQASTVMASQVITTGRLLFDGDSRARGSFEDYVHSAYARLNEERRGILERIAAEGTVYGR